MTDLPSSNVRQLDTERFIIFCGTAIKPWVYSDEPFDIDRRTAIDMIASGEPPRPSKVVAFDLTNGKCRDATREIIQEVSNKWAHQGEPLTYNQYALIELHLGTRVARSFVCHEVA